MNEEVISKSDPFWLNDPSILWNKHRYVEFFPNTSMKLSEKLNALVRLSIYVALVLIVFYRNYLYLYIPIIMFVFTYFVWRVNLNKPPVKERFGDDGDGDNTMINYGLEQDEIKSGECVSPTVNNPFMNINQITDKRNRAPACQYYDNPKVEKSVEKNFNFNLYRDVSDLYNKNNSQRQYYTMPSTTIPNEQTAFAKWLYYSPPICKEDTIRCVPETIPPPLPGNGLDYLQLE